MDASERLARVETLVEELRGDVAEMKHDWREQWELLRGRTHVLEKSEMGLTAAQAALEAARVVRQQTFSRWDRVLVCFCTVLVAATALVSLLTR